VNIFTYNVTVSEKGKKGLEKEGGKIKKADNGSYYLPKGKYTIQINSESIDFEIK